jgi:DNA polymerase-3 subunit alpha
MEHLSALLAIIRPGCLDAEYDDKNITSHYIDKKNHAEEAVCIHPSLESILEPTYFEMIYQESLQKIAIEIGNFTPSDANVLRKAFGKKKFELINELEKKFIDGAKEVGAIGPEMAQQLYSMMRKSGRYVFNKSHSVGYAYLCYLSAYIKAHMPRAFYTSQLRQAKDKPKPYERMKRLVDDAKEHYIYIKNPDIRVLRKDFSVYNRHIYYGITNIKGIGESNAEKFIKKYQDSGVDFDKLSWFEFLIECSSFGPKTLIEALINSGALDYLGEPRKKMSFEYTMFRKLKAREYKWVLDNTEKSDWPTTLQELLFFIIKAPVGRNGCCSSSKRFEAVQDLYNIVKNPPQSLQDTPLQKAQMEESLLGLPITCLPIDKYKRKNAILCQDYLTNQRPGVILCVVDDVHEKITKHGDRMAMVTIRDNSATMRVLAFPDIYDRFSDYLYIGSALSLYGVPSNRDDNMTFIIKDINKANGEKLHV